MSPGIYRHLIRTGHPVLAWRWFWVDVAGQGRYPAAFRAGQKPELEHDRADNNYSVKLDGDSV